MSSRGKIWAKLFITLYSIINIEVFLYSIYYFFKGSKKRGRKGKIHFFRGLVKDFFPFGHQDPLLLFFQCFNTVLFSNTVFSVVKIQ